MFAVAVVTAIAVPAAAAGELDEYPRRRNGGARGESGRDARACTHTTENAMESAKSSNGQKVTFVTAIDAHSRYQPVSNGRNGLSRLLRFSFCAGLFFRHYILPRYISTVEMEMMKFLGALKMTTNMDNDGSSFK